MQQHYIKGQVLDARNNPIEYIWVRIYRRIGQFLNQIEYTITDQNGRYDFTLDHGSPITIRYDDRRFGEGLDNLHPAVVNSLSGALDHNLNKVMYWVNRSYTQDEILEILSTYESIRCIDTANHIPPNNEVLSRYPGYFLMIKYVDAITEQRWKQVCELYDIRL